MRCPYCISDSTRVLDTRSADEHVRRRRECSSCKRRFSTSERFVRTDLMIIKSDGRREQFKPDKLFGGLQAACTKRPISMQSLEQMVNQIEKELYDLGSSEVHSKTIGEKVMQQLMALDDVAYIRFASVYLGIDDLESLSEEIKKLQEKKKA